MAASATTIAPGEHVPTADQRVVTYGVTWERYEIHLAMRGESSVPRLTYLEGALEIMSPSRDHERIKSYLGRLVETYALERGFDFSPYGSWTLRSAPREAGLEPDECYIVGDQDKDRPDLAIEVIWTSGGLDKLEIYRRLGVPEVWTWRNDRIEVHLLRGDAYVPSSTSGLFPELDLALLVTFLDHPSAARAILAYREALRAQ